MRDNFTADWAFGIRGAIEKVVRDNFPEHLRSWPLLQAFNFEAYILPNNYMALILIDKLSGITAGPGTAKDFQFNDYPKLPPEIEDIKEWQFYLRDKFSLKPEDACFLIPVHDSGKANAWEDYKLFTAKEKLFWDQQIKSVVSAQQSHLQGLKDQLTNHLQPVNINYFTGANSRVNINSTDSSSNYSTETLNIFSQLRETLDQIDDVEAKRKLSSDIDAMESSYGRRDFLENYKNFMATAANHMTLFSPLIPQLTLLLT
jgi:molybdopterin converting factor small subunit